MPTSPAGEDGFTLLELLVVLAILGTVAAIVAPRLSAPQPNVRAQAVLVSDKLRQLRRQATARSEIRALTIEQAAADLRPGFSLTAIDEADRRIVFYPLGYSNGAQWLLKGPENAMTIDVDWLTGIPEIVQP